MLILAFDTSGFGGSVALLEGERVLVERQLDANRRSAQTLAPATAEALSEAGVRPADVRLVATTIGPGSFTGLRVGVTAAKSFAYAARCDVIGLNTLDVIAAQVPADFLPSPFVGEGSGVRGSDSPDYEIHAILDAQRKELFLARFRPAAAGPERLAEDTIIAAQSWLDPLRPGTIVTGPGLHKLESLLPPGVIAAPQPLREPRAATAGAAAWREYQRGRRDDLWRLAPAYGRPSYAEERRP
ncbi:MAG TPA: tRNA (adenosine(37)-N6)-threonylcarbamoyltransferase complex dimerization subunit type 1 TsaB [Pirellulaceae bacterium]|nr:tRNA (adenosine(37)-N6)-threonylcarbamoyltransferase complex dimerization subunit type 1 TsaB [Pirellulaceae bacterium]